MLINVNRVHPFLSHMTFYSCIALLMYNFIFCLLWGAGFEISELFLMVFQALLFIFVLLVTFYYSNTSLYPMMILIITVISLLSLFLGFGASYKSIFEILVLPVFIFAGMISSIPMKKIQIAIFGIIILNLLITLFEYIFPSYYVSFIPVGEYLLNTRSWMAEAANGNEYEFYLAAARPDGSALGFSEQRVGGIFLESLTNSYFLSSLIFLVLFFFKSNWMRFWLILPIIFSLLVADVRVGLALSVFYIMCYRFLSGRISVSILLVFLILYFSGYLYSEYTDGNLSYRLSLNYDFWKSASFLELMGFGNISGNSSDSAYIKLINTVGLPIVLVMLIATEMVRLKYRNGFLMFMLMFSVALTSFFGAAFFSAKVAPFIAYLVGWGLKNGNEEVPSSTQYNSTLSNTIIR